MQNPSGEISPTMKGKPAINIMSTCIVCACSMVVRSPEIMGGDDLFTSHPLRLGIDGPHIWSATAKSFAVTSESCIFMLARSFDGMYPNRV